MNKMSMLIFSAVLFLPVFTVVADKQVDKLQFKYEHHPESKLTKRKVGSGMAYSLSGKTLKPVE